MIYLRLTWAFFTFLVYYVFSLFLSVPGFVLVPFAIWFGVHRKSRIYPATDIFTAPNWLHLYGNEQEGYDSPFALVLYKGWPTFWRRYSWAAWRNKTANLRFIKWMHPPPDPKRIRFVKRARWWLCWQGPLYCFHYTKKSGAIFKIGWKYKPEDVDGVAPDDWRLWGCGFTFRPNAT